MIEIRYLLPEDYSAFRAIRLRALREEPDAFGETYARASARSEDDWREWMLATVVAGRKNIVCAEEDGQAVGMCGFGISDSDSAMGFLWGMFVAGTHRNKGCGRRLLAEAEEWVASHGGRALKACVAAPNETAIRFYQKNGYTIGEQSGTLRPDSAIPVFPIEKGLAWGEA